MMTKLLELDTELFLFLNNQGTAFWDPFWLMVSGVAIWIPLYALLAFLIIFKLDGNARWWALLALIVNVVLTDQGSVWLFKEQFLRLRPCHVTEIADQIRLVKGSCGGQYGFVSSHAANTFGLAILAGLMLRPYFKNLIVLLILWALMVGYSRIYLGVHYPGDILIGALYGGVVGYIVFKLFNTVSTR